MANIGGKIQEIFLTTGYKVEKYGSYISSAIFSLGSIGWLLAGSTPLGALIMANGAFTTLFHGMTSGEKAKLNSEILHSKETEVSEQWIEEAMRTNQRYIKNSSLTGASVGSLVGIGLGLGLATGGIGTLAMIGASTLAGAAAGRLWGKVEASQHEAVIKEDPTLESENWFVTAGIRATDSIGNIFSGNPLAILRGIREGISAIFSSDNHIYLQEAEVSAQ